MARRRFVVAALALLLGSLGSRSAWALNDGLGAPPPGVERDSPLSTVQGFNEAVHDGDYEAAAHYLALDHLGRAKQVSEGPRLARRFRFVLDRKLQLDFAKLGRELPPEGPQPRFQVLGTVTLKNAEVPIRLERFANPAGGNLWLFSPDTVRSIDKLYDAYGPPFAEKLPDFVFERSVGSLELWQWLGLVLVIGLSVLAGLLVQRLVLRIADRLAKLTPFQWDDQLVDAVKGPVLVPPAMLVFAAGSRALLLSPEVQRVVDLLARSLLIISIVWFLLRALSVTSRYVETKLTGEILTGRERSLRTQVAVLRRVAGVVIWVVGGALFLLQFDVVRNVGVSLLASAGIAGLAIGLAAQKSLSSLLAGIQLSITQPIRIGDSIVVEGQSGSVEEIHLTYVIVRLWDLRRMVVPITHFLDKPFENWSRRETDMLGILTIDVDYSADVEAFRNELRRVLEGEAKPLWDGKTATLQVSEANAAGIVLRMLLGAPTSSKGWDLRCLVRERLVQFLQRHPEWMIARRTESRVLPVTDSAAKPQVPSTP